MRGWRRPLLLAGACWVAFLGVLGAAYGIGFVERADGRVVREFLDHQSPLLHDVSHAIAKLADPLPFGVLTLGIAYAAWRQRRPRHGLAAVVLLVGASALTQVLKQVLAHPRAHEILGQAQLADASFPSGHATAAWSVAIAAMLVAPPARRLLVGAAGTVYAAAVSIAILVLAWHFPSDVVGGFLVACACGLTVVAALGLSLPSTTGRWSREVRCESGAVPPL